MRKRNTVLVRLGLFAVVIGLIFFVVAMMWLAPESNDPAEVMRIAGQASGTAVSIGIIMFVLGLIGRKQA